MARSFVCADHHSADPSAWSEAGRSTAAADAPDPSSESRRRQRRRQRQISRSSHIVAAVHSRRRHRAHGFLRQSAPRQWRNYTTAGMTLSMSQAKDRQNAKIIVRITVPIHL